MSDFINRWVGKLPKKKIIKTEIQYMGTSCVLCGGNIKHFRIGDRFWYGGNFSPTRYGEFRAKGSGRVCAECVAKHSFAHCPTCGALNSSSTFHPSHCAKCNKQAKRLDVSSDEYDESSGEWKAILHLQADVNDLKAQIRDLSG